MLLVQPAGQMMQPLIKHRESRKEIPRGEKGKQCADVGRPEHFDPTHWMQMRDWTHAHPTHSGFRVSESLGSQTGTGGPGRVRVRVGEVRGGGRHALGPEDRRREHDAQVGGGHLRGLVL